MKNSIWVVILSAIIFSSGCSDAQSKKKEIVLISTEFGDMKVMLYDETPIHKENFLKLAGEGFYDSLIFHRVINEFMVQGGNANLTDNTTGKKFGKGGPEYTLPAEFNPALYHKKGALCAARIGDQANPEKESSGSQFYIVHGKIFDETILANMEARSGKKYTAEQKEVYNTIGGTPHLDHNYTVFGEVIEGIEVIDKIAAVQTGQGNRPIENVYMQMKLVKK